MLRPSTLFWGFIGKFSVRQFFAFSKPRVGIPHTPFTKEGSKGRRGLSSSNLAINVSIKYFFYEGRDWVNCLERVQSGHTISIKKFQDFSKTFQEKSLFFKG